MEQIWFDGFKLNDFVTILDVQGMGIPQVRSYKTNVIGRNGTVYDSSDLEERVVTIECLLREKKGDIMTLEQKFDRLKAIISPLLGERQLNFDKPTGTRTLFCRYEGIMDIENLLRSKRFPLTFVASDPLFYSGSSELMATGTNITINNDGTAPSRRWRLNMDPFSGEGEIKATRQPYTLNLAQPSQAKPGTLIINGYEKRIEQDGKGAHEWYSSGKFFQLETGIVTISCPTNATLFWRKAYL